MGSSTSIQPSSNRASTGLVGPMRGVELTLNLLITDISGDLRLSVYGLALLDKLFGVKLYRELCKQAAEECSSIVLKEKNEKSGVVSGIGTSRAHAAAHLESFLHFIVGAFDVLASITVRLYPDHASTISPRYSRKQMRTIIDNPNISPEYADLLARNEHWIEDVHDNRDGLAHKASAFLGFENDGRIEFEKRRPYDDKDVFAKKAFEDLLKYLDTTLEHLYGFLDRYVEVHRKRVQVSERSKLLLDALERGDLKEYYY